MPSQSNRLAVPLLLISSTLVAAGGWETWVVNAEEPVVAASDASAETDRPPPLAADHATQLRCTDEPDESQAAMKIEATPFGTTPAGEKVTLYTCTNANGLLVSLIDYGATVVQVDTPDRDGKLANINLGFPTLSGYLGPHPHFGSTIGRFCNRIAKGKFTLAGKEYLLATNNGANHLHGGKIGFDKYLWQAEEVKTVDAVGVKFSRRSEAGEEGYPGNLDVTVAYVLTNDNELRVEFTAVTDESTPLNLTNHNYWNLAGAGAGKVLDHEATIFADHYLAVDAGLIPTGELAPVAGTPLDFRTARPLGERLGDIDAEPKGYDHCFVLRGQAGGLALAARVKDPGSGRVMEIYTTQPGIQLYTGNFLDGSAGNGGFGQHEAFCLETQHYPDSPNQPDFPSSILNPGESFRQLTVHRFSIE